MLNGCGTGSGSGSKTSSQPVQLTVAVTGTGTVTSSPAGINCPSNCSASFAPGTSVTLTATAGSGFAFTGYSGACSGSTCQLSLSSNQSVSATFTPTPQLTVTVTGQGTITSSPAGINCPTTCTAAFASGSSVSLTATPQAGNSFSGFTGACTGASCQLTISSTAGASVTATFSPQNINTINHIIVITQENRSFDQYFGHLPDYWQAHGYPQATDGTTLDVAPSNASNVDDNGATVNWFNLQSACNENPSPSWNESHVDRNANNPTDSNNGPGDTPMDGLVQTAAGDAQGNGFYDVLGHRAMGYFVGDQLNYYYFMASNFATSDRWFSPVMSRTQVNRMYLYGASSEGHAYPLNTSNSKQLSGTTIFDRMEQNSVSWKIYIHPITDPNDPCVNSTTPACLAPNSYLNQWTDYQYFLNNSPNQFQPVSQLLTDMQNGTLPQVAFLEPAGYAGLDEHASDNDVVGPSAPNVQAGAAYVANIINTLMASPSWKDTVLILTYDEFGGFYDHVSPQPATPPDTTAYPTDLLGPNDSSQTFYDVCLEQTTAYTVDPTPICGFDYTGYRLPLIVVSPFTKKNYVSHLVMDYTAILKLIETRFNLTPLTARDAAQPDMSAEFLDFVNVPWATPPTPQSIPTQSKGMQCELEALSSITFTPNPAPAGSQAMVTLSLSHATMDNVTVSLSSNPPGVVPSSEQFLSTTTPPMSSIQIPITVPTGITSLTVTGSIGGISVSGTVPVQ